MREKKLIAHSNNCFSLRAVHTLSNSTNGYIQLIQNIIFFYCGLLPRLLMRLEVYLFKVQGKSDEAFLHKTTVLILETWNQFFDVSHLAGGFVPMLIHQHL